MIQKNIEGSVNGIILVNFGGPRSTDEIRSFLIELLTDIDVIHPALPLFFHRLLFTWIAWRRSKKVAHDYHAIGGKSPIFEDTVAIGDFLRNQTEGPVLTFHRYLPSTHDQFLKDIKVLEGCDSVQVFPLFPQFSYTTTGSVARWFSTHFSRTLKSKLSWVKSYPTHPGFVQSFQATLRHTLEQHQLKEEETLLLFSAHGLPKSYVTEGDPYQEECKKSCEQIVKAFPKAAHQLCYQSLFGKEEWLRPYTSEVCAELLPKNQQNVVIVPLSFPSDHIETLFEIEQQYLPPLKNNGWNAIRCPAMNLRQDWLNGIVHILATSEECTNESLVRPLRNKNETQDVKG